MVANEPATLVYLANQGCITPHLGLSRCDEPDRPDQLILDLDPSDGDFAKVQKAARLLRRLFDDLDLPSFVKTTGSRGLHVLVPLDRSADFDTARDFARAVAERLAVRHDRLVTVEQRKDKRGDRVFLDYLRNAYGQTAVAPYGVRAIDGASVAAPLRWDEALAGALSPRKYAITNIFRRLVRTGDVWRGVGCRAGAVAAAHERLAELD